MGQRYDADGRGSEVVAVARSECGLDLGKICHAVLKLRGIDPQAPWPTTRSKEEPLYTADGGKKMSSSVGSKKTSMLYRMRAILLRMQLQCEHPALLDLNITKISSYCWKISGTTAMHSQKKDKAMITGQGRWGLYVNRPSAMIEYYRQAPLDEKLATTDLKKTKPKTKTKRESTPTPTTK